MTYHIEDAELGQIIIHVNQRAKSIIVRKKESLIHVTAPPFSTEHHIRKTLNEIKPRILSMKSVDQQIINESYTLQTHSFNVSVSRNNLSRIYLNLKDGVLQITVPISTDIHLKSVQQQLRKLIESALRHEAKRILPDYVKQLASLHGFQYASLKINKSKSRWGSCNSKKCINLSYFCMLLPLQLLELVILHELCHTREMNHSKSFWKELDHVTNKQAKELTKALRGFSTSF